MPYSAPCVVNHSNGPTLQPEQGDSPAPAQVYSGWDPEQRSGLDHDSWALSTSGGAVQRPDAETVRVDEEGSWSPFVCM